MRIAFKGIENLKVLKQEKEEFGTFTKPNNETVPSINKTQIVKIYCNFTNDKNDNDLEKYKKSTQKTYLLSGTDYTNSTDPTKCCISVTTEINNTQSKKYTNSKISLNDKDIELTSDNLLPLYSFLAQLTTKLTNTNLTTLAQKEYTQFVNDKINDKARKYFEVV